MSNFSTSPNNCRVDFFKPSGKWYDTDEVQFRGSDFNNTNIFTAFQHALQDASLWDKLKKFDCVCLEPYHENTHPICIKTTWI